MSRSYVFSLLFALASCGPKEAPIETPAAPVEAPAPDPRFVKPAPLAKRPLTLPEVKTATLSNGLQVVLIEDHELPLFSLQLTVRSGAFTDPAGKEGLADLAMNLLDEGTAKKDTIAFATAQKKLGASVGSYSGGDSAGLSVSGLTKNLDATLDLMAEVLLTPRNDKNDLERLRKDALQGILAQRTEPNAMAGRALARTMYGETYSGRFETEASLKAVTAKDVAAWQKANLTPANGIIFASGDLSLDALVTALEARLGKWKGGTKQADPTITVNALTETTLFLVDKPGAAQSVILAAREVPGRNEPGYDALVLGNAAWGGTFMSRFNMNFREEKGWTYGARSSVEDDLGPGTWSASTSVRADATVVAVQELLAELDRVKGEKPLTAQEVEYVRSSMINSWPGRFETPSFLLGQQASIWRYGLPADWTATYLSRVQAVTPEAAQAAFVEHVAAKPLALVVVGDLATHQAPLAALGKPVVVLDADGRVVKK